MPLQEYVVRWAGARVGAGASVFHFQSVAGSAAAQPLANAVRAMFFSLIAAFPDDISFSFDSEVRELSEAGALLAAYPITAPPTTGGSSSAAFASGTGLMVRHNTGVILGGKRVRGRTFMVPVSSASFTTNGDVLASTVSAFNAAFATLITAANGVGAPFSVWSRANAAIVPVVSSATQVRPSTMKTRNDRL